MKKVSYIIILFLSIFFATPQRSFSSNSSEYYSKDHKISIDAVFGFNNSIKQSSYNQAVFFIKNDGKDFSGKLSVKTGVGYSKNGPFSVESKKVYLPELSKKRIYIYFFCENISPSTPIIFELESDDGKNVFSVDLTSEKKIKVLNSYSVRDGVAGFLTVVVSDKSYGYNFLTGVNNAPPKVPDPGIIYNRIEGHTIEYPSYETLPDAAIGYDSVNLILLSDTSASKLSYDQKKAITRYLNEGGNILILKSDNDLWMENEYVKSLLPVSITGKKTLNTIGGFSYNAVTESITYSNKIQVTDYQVLDVALKDSAEVFSSSDGVPLILKKRVGSGILIFTAFDPSNTPFAGRKETISIFSNIFNLLLMNKGVPMDYQLNSSMVGVFNNLMDAIITKDIIKKIVIFFMIAFIVYIIMLGPGNYFILKFKRKLEYAWFTIPIISVLFSLVFLVSGYAARGSENHIFTYNIVKFYGPDDLRLQSFMSVFASRADTYDVDIDRQNIAVKNFNFNRRNEDDWEVEDGEVIKIKGINIKKWSVRNFTINGYIDVTAGSSAVFKKTGSTNYYIDYKLPFKIYDSFIATRGQVYRIKAEDIFDTEVTLGGKKAIYYDKLIEFMNSKAATFDSDEKIKEKKLYGAGKRYVKTDLINFLNNKNLLGNHQNDFFIAFTKDSVLNYELKGTKFAKDDKTIIVIPLEEL